MAGAPVPGGQRGSMKFEGLQVPDKTALVAENGQAFVPLPVPAMPTQLNAQMAQQPVAKPTVRRTNELFPELPPTQGKDLICTVAIMQDGTHRFMEPFYAAHAEWAVLRDYIREWAQANRVDVLFEFSSDASECGYLVPRTRTSREELERRLREAMSGDNSPIQPSVPVNKRKTRSRKVDI